LASLHRRLSPLTRCTLPRQSPSSRPSWRRPPPSPSRPAALRPRPSAAMPSTPRPPLPAPARAALSCEFAGYPCPGTELPGRRACLRSQRVLCAPQQRRGAICACVFVVSRVYTKATGTAAGRPTSPVNSQVRVGCALFWHVGPGLASGRTWGTTEDSRGDRRMPESLSPSSLMRPLVPRA